MCLASADRFEEAAFFDPNAGKGQFTAVLGNGAEPSNNNGQHLSGQHYSNEFHEVYEDSTLGAGLTMTTGPTTLAATHTLNAAVKQTT